MPLWFHMELYMSDIDTTSEITDEDWIDDDAEIDEFGIIIEKDVIDLLDSLGLSPKTDVEESSTEEEETSVKKKKRPKKIVDPFVKINKQYFSSMNARTAKYAIFNLNEQCKDKLIMMSSKARTTFEDYLYQYHPGDLSIQIVEFKNDDLKTIKDKLSVTEDCTLINLASLRKYVNMACKHPDIEILPISIARTDTGDIYLKVVDPKTEQTIIERIGFHYTNWRILVLLQGLVDFMTRDTFECQVLDKVIYTDIEPYIDQNLIIYPVSTNRYKDPDGKVIFNHIVDGHMTKLYMIDGKDVISVKEYVKKLKTEYSLEIISFVHLPDRCIFFKTKFEDDTNIVISSRPYVSIFPICVTAEEFKK